MFENSLSVVRNILHLWKRINLNAEMDTKISLYSFDDKEYYLVRHFPFGFVNLSKEYLETLLKMYAYNFAMKKNPCDLPMEEQLLNYINLEKKELTSELKLRRLNLLVAQKCNCRCRYCYAGNGNYGMDSFMPLDIAKKAINSVFEYYDAVENIQFFGGEPLLAPEVIESIIKYTEDIAIKSKKQCPRFSVVTNLTCLPENIFKLIKERKLDVFTSLDGPARIHNQNRRFADGSPTYETVIENIRKIIPFSQPKTIEATYTIFHKKIGMTPIEIKQHISSICERAQVIVVPDLNLPYDKEECFSHFELIYYCQSGTDLSDPNIQQVLRKYLAVVSGKRRKDIFCDLGTSNFTVDTQGKIWPCHILCNKSEPIGIIGERWDLIKRRYNESLGKYIKKSCFLDCKTCFLQDFCTSCPIAWKRDNGKMSPIKPQCELDRKFYLTAFRMALKSQKEGKHDGN